ncbi:putative zinc finger protein, partial [Orchesella cincta]
ACVTMNQKDDNTSQLVRLYLCDFERCLKSYTRRRNLIAHQRTHMGDRPYRCSWENHRKTHNGEKPFCCGWEGGCSFKFRSNEDLKRHYRTHKQENPFLCQYCPAHFPERLRKSVQISTKQFNILRKLYSVTHGNQTLSTEPFVQFTTETSDRGPDTNGEVTLIVWECSICLVVFISDNEKELSTHMSDAHQQLLAFQCVICSKKLKTMENVRSHMFIIHGKLLHKNKDLVREDIVSLSFLEETTHESREKAVKSQSHSVCDRDIDTESRTPGSTGVMTNDLIQEVHNSPKMGNYKCGFQKCDKVFVRKYSLVEHERVHTGDKPYHCSWPGCEWKFAQSGNCLRHYKTHTKRVYVKCEMCQKTLRPEYLKKHKRTIHGIFESQPTVRPCSTSVTES